MRYNCVRLQICRCSVNIQQCSYSSILMVVCVCKWHQFNCSCFFLFDHNFKVNSTGFLVQNYENLGDTNIDTFFISFKQQIKSTQIKSENVIEFVRGLYDVFFFTTNIWWRRFGCANSHNGIFSLQIITRTFT